jgi:hypothetical protein
MQNLIIPFNVNSITQIIIYNLLLEMGFRITIVSFIILFL